MVLFSFQLDTFTLYFTVISMRILVLSQAKQSQDAMEELDQPTKSTTVNLATILASTSRTTVAGINVLQMLTATRAITTTVRICMTKGIDGFGFDCVTNCASICSDASRFTFCFCGNHACVPCVICFFNMCRIVCAYALMLIVIQLCPSTVVVAVFLTNISIFHRYFTGVAHTRVFGNSINGSGTFFDSLYSAIVINSGNLFVA